MEKSETQVLVGEIVCMPRTTRYGAKNNPVKVIKYVKKGLHSYFSVQSLDGRVFNVPSKYLKSKKLTNAIKIPVPDTSKPSINKKPKKN